MKPSDAKILDGIKHVEKAEKYLKKSLLKWSSDYDSAADEYNKAAISFQNASAFEECKSAYIKAADAYIKANSGATAARCYEQTALVQKELNEWDDCFNNMCKAADLFLQEGSTRSALLSYTKGAKILERPKPEKAADLYIKAAELSMGEDDPSQTAEFYYKIAQIYARLDRLFDSAYYLNKDLDVDVRINNLHRLSTTCLALVVVHLCREDSVSANLALNLACSSLEFAGSTVCGVCLKLIKAYEEGDTEALEQLKTKDNTIKNMDNDFLIIARKLKTAFEDQPSGAQSGSEPVDERTIEDPVLANHHRQRRKSSRFETELNSGSEASNVKFARELQTRLSIHALSKQHGEPQPDLSPDKKRESVTIKELDDENVAKSEQDATVEKPIIATPSSDTSEDDLK